MIRRLLALCAFAALPLAPLHAQTVYDQIKPGDVLEHHIGMGVFSRDLPLPPGRWQVLGVYTNEIQTVGKTDPSLRGQLDRLTFVMKNEAPQALLPLMSVSLTPRATNIDWRAYECPNVNRPDQWLDNLGTKSTDRLFACMSSRLLYNFPGLLASAESSPQEWERRILGLANTYASDMPMHAVHVSTDVKRYSGRSYVWDFFVRMDAPLNSVQRYHLQSWTTRTGLSLMGIANDDKVELELPPAF